MGKINILDSSIFNLISAGEVVDKPMSVVKELVENSIDAKADKIEIEVKNGGIDYIRVVDDGCGIEKDDMKKAFLPHATSKISSVDDLNSILTLGFRGEALASISAVARVTLISRIEGAEFGYTVIYENGELISEYECGCPKGTVVTVEKIFDKIPARQKYLRSASSEEADILNLVTRLILSNPRISIKYSSESKNLFSTGEGEKSALIAIYGNDILSNTEEISLVMPDITIRGYIGKPSFSKHSRNYQTLVVNGRYVKNEDISYMIYLCYKDFLMSRQYPMFVIYIDIPADMVDVNVHPNKMDVKFVQLDRIKKLIRSIINSKLNNVALEPKIIENAFEKKTLEVKAIESDSKNNDAIAADYEKRSTVSSDLSFINNKRELRESPAHVLRYGIKNMPSNMPYDFPVIENSKKTNEVIKSSVYKDGFGQNDDLSSTNFLDDESLLTVGTLFSTYIIIQQNNDCFFIDQHAAHERILYDKLVKQINNGKPIVQNLLFPYSFYVSFDEGELLEKNLSLFSECGFEIVKEDGQRYKINAVPAIVAEMSFSKFLPMFFDAIKMNSITNAALIKDMLAQSACKAAIKGDRLLSMQEIEYLIKGINTLDALLCPHGRPIAVKISKTEIDKWFKRK